MTSGSEVIPWCFGPLHQTYYFFCFCFWGKRKIYYPGYHNYYHLEAQCRIKLCAVRVPRTSCNQGRVIRPVSVLHLCGPCPVNLHAHRPCLAGLLSLNCPCPMTVLHLSHPTKLHTNSPSPTLPLLPQLPQEAPCLQQTALQSSVALPHHAVRARPVLWSFEPTAPISHHHGPSHGWPGAHGSHSLSSLACCLVIHPVILVVSAPGFLHIRIIIGGFSDTCSQI